MCKKDVKSRLFSYNRTVIITITTRQRDRERQTLNVVYLCIMFNQIQEDNIFALGSDRSVKWVLCFHFKHVVSERCRHVSKVISSKVILHTRHTVKT